MIDIDVIGTLYATGAHDAEGNELTPATALPGYHVNTTYSVADWAAYKVTPTTPRRVFGGHETHFYTFADAAEYESNLSTADLSIQIAPVVPRSISKRQAERVLHATGQLETVEAIIAAASTEVQIDWRSAKDLERTWPTLLAMQSALGWTDAYVDSLFVDGESL